MKNATTKKQTTTTPGFAIEIKDDTELDGILMQELHIPGEYIAMSKPVAAVVSINEAREIAASHHCAEACTYRLWARGLGGDYVAIATPILVCKK